MPQNITDAATFTAPIVAPSDGDDLDAASVLVGLQGLANRARYLYNFPVVRGYRENFHSLQNPAVAAQTTGSATYVTVSTSDTISVPDTGVPCAVGDRIFVLATCMFTAALGIDQFVYASSRLTILSASQAVGRMDGSETSWLVSVAATGSSVDGYTNVTMIGSHTALYAETYNPGIQMKKDSGSGGDISIQQNWRWWSVVVKPRV